MVTNNKNSGLTAKQQQALVDQIVKILKVQADRRRDVTTRGSQIINPQNLVLTNPTTFGPFYFGTTFANAPYIAFGQLRMQQQQYPAPFVVQPYVDSWVVSSGGIQGLNLGIYALMPVPSGLKQHTISWLAVGKASLYKSNNSNETWNSAYSTTKATNLFQKDGAMEKPY